MIINIVIDILSCIIYNNIKLVIANIFAKANIKILKRLGHTNQKNTKHLTIRRNLLW